LTKVGPVLRHGILIVEERSFQARGWRKSWQLGNVTGGRRSKKRMGEGKRGPSKWKKSPRTLLIAEGTKEKRDPRSLLRRNATSHSI